MTTNNSVQRRVPCLSRFAANLSAAPLKCGPNHDKLMMIDIKDAPVLDERRTPIHLGCGERARTALLAAKTGRIDGHSYAPAFGRY